MTELLPDPAVEHKRARNDAVEIHYVVAGRSEAVVLLHGFPQTWLPWRKIIPLLALEDEFEIEFPETMLRKSTFESVAAIRKALDELTGP